MYKLIKICRDSRIYDDDDIILIAVDEDKETYKTLKVIKQMEHTDIIDGDTFSKDLFYEVYRNKDYQKVLERGMLEVL